MKFENDKSQVDETRKNISSFITAALLHFKDWFFRNLNLPQKCCPLFLGRRAFGEGAIFNHQNLLSLRGGLEFNHQCKNSQK